MFEIFFKKMKNSNISSNSLIMILKLIKTIMMMTMLINAYGDAMVMTIMTHR